MLLNSHSRPLIDGWLAMLADALAPPSADLVGRPELVRPGALPARPGEPLTLVADTRRLPEEVAFSPRIPLREGLVATIDWWRSELCSGAR